MQYKISKAAYLSEEEIQTILSCWNVAEWLQMSVAGFKKHFFNSEFHLLRNNDSIVSIARINVDFYLRINNTLWHVAEFVGFASIIEGRGYGSELLRAVMNTVKEFDIACIGFCEKELRAFYEKRGIPILYNAAKYILEKDGADWASSADDDILVLHATDADRELLNSLSKDNPGYLEDPIIVA